ncbi:MAG: hypothetical protein Q7T18_00465 [Sedimentisphaerales bacterium]|nr:hypothetical protein [Sedimentisphaerales bacterium]
MVIQILSLGALLFFSAPNICAAPTQSEIAQIQNSFKQMHDEDQVLINAEGTAWAKGPNSADYKQAKIAFDQMMLRHISALESVIRKWGWPGISVFGLETDQNAWLVCQHAYRQSSFQKRCLNILEDAWKRGDTDNHNVPSLTDSIEKSEGRPQIFGTYGNPNKQGCWEWLPIADIEHADERRARYNLPTLEQERKGYDRHYGCTPAAKAP